MDNMELVDVRTASPYHQILSRYLITIEYLKDEQPILPQVCAHLEKLSRTSHLQEKVFNFFKKDFSSMRIMHFSNKMVGDVFSCFEKQRLEAGIDLKTYYESFNPDISFFHIPFDNVWVEIPLGVAIQDPEGDFFKLRAFKIVDDGVNPMECVLIVDNIVKGRPLTTSLMYMENIAKDFKDLNSTNHAFMESICFMFHKWLARIHYLFNCSKRFTTSLRMRTGYRLKQSKNHTSYAKDIIYVNNQKSIDTQDMPFLNVDLENLNIKDLNFFSEVVGHWRKMKDGFKGKDRRGERTVLNRTWIDSYTRKSTRNNSSSIRVANDKIELIGEDITPMD